MWSLFPPLEPGAHPPFTHLFLRLPFLPWADPTHPPSLFPQMNFHDLPNEQHTDLNVKPDGGKNNEEQEKILRESTSRPTIADPITELEGSDPLHRRFFALFGKVKSKKEKSQGSVPKSADLEKSMHVQTQEAAPLPNVAETEEEKLAKQEDMERRKAYMEKYKHDAEETKAHGHEVDAGAHDSFVAFFNKGAKSKK